jgi:broad specificity phosphatase PhoE
MIEIVRHAQSLSNAGIQVHNTRTVGLSAEGKQQAELLAARFDSPPDYVIVSDAMRTKLTAAPLLKKFPNLMFCIMPVHEFYFIDNYRMRGKTPEERWALLDEYFAKNDPDYTEGTGESFNHFIARVREFLDGLDRTKNILIISHGHFINGVKMVAHGLPLTVKQFATMQYVEHCEGIVL